MAETEPQPKRQKTTGEEKTGLKGSPLTYPLSDRFLRLLIDTKADFVRPPENKIFVAQRTDNLADVWKGLVQHNFLSVPVLQKTKSKWYGFLDMYDIVKFVVDTFGDVEKLKSAHDWFVAASQSETFNKKTVDDVMRTPRTKRNPFHPIHKGYSLFAAIEALAREPSLHRVPVIDNDFKLITVITQSQIVQNLLQNLDILGEKRNKPVYLTERYLEPVVTVLEDTPSIDAFKVMVEKNVSGVGVVNGDGVLTGVLSLKDLKSMSTDVRLFWRLYQPVKHCIAHLTQEVKDVRPSHLITVKGTDTLEMVIRKLAEHHIHRVFIADEHGKPSGVITLKDVLCEIIN